MQFQNPMEGLLDDRLEPLRNLITSEGYSADTALGIFGIIALHKDRIIMERLYRLSPDQNRELIQKAKTILEDRQNHFKSGCIGGVCIALALLVPIYLLGNLIACLLLAVPMAVVGLVCGSIFERVRFEQEIKGFVISEPMIDHLNPASGVVR